MQKNTEWWQWGSFFSHISYYLISIKYPWFRCGARKSFFLGVLCTQVSGVWSRCARGISTLYLCAVIYIAPVPETGFGEDDTATVGPIYLHVTKFGKKVKIEKQIAHAPLIFFLRAHASVGPIYIGYLNEPCEPPCLMSVDPNSF